MSITHRTLTVEQLKSIGFVETPHPSGEKTAMRFKDITVVLTPFYGLCESGSVLGWASYSSDFKYHICGHDFSTLEKAVASMYAEAWNHGRDAGLQEKAQEIRRWLMIETP